MRLPHLPAWPRLTAPPRVVPTPRSVLIPTGRQRSPWSRSLPCDALAPVPLGFIIVILFIFSIKKKKSHIHNVCRVGLSALPLSLLQAASGPKVCSLWKGRGALSSPPPLLCPPPTSCILPPSPLEWAQHLPVLGSAWVRKAQRVGALASADPGEMPSFRPSPPQPQGRVWRVPLQSKLERGREWAPACSSFLFSPFPVILADSMQPPLPPSSSAPKRSCALGCGPEVCGQGRLALRSSGLLSPSRAAEVEGV